MKSFINLILIVLCIIMLMFSVALAGSEHGTFTGTGADQQVLLGFVPVHITIYNGEGWAIEWFAGFTNDTAMGFSNAIDGSSRQSIWNGVTPLPAIINATTGSITNAPGIILGGSGNGINTNGETLYWSADR